MRQLKITKSITNRESASLDKYLQEIGHETLISTEEEVELAQRIKKGDRKALEKLTRANLRFVVSVAKQYQNQGLSLPDLINEGNLGLLKAAEKFDETRGFKFISYAVWWIRQSIMQAIAEQSRIVRLPLNQVGSANKIATLLNQFEQKNERRPSVDEIADQIDLPQDKIEDALKVNGRHTSIDAPLIDGEDNSLLDILQDDDMPQTDNELVMESLRDEIGRALSTLSERERKIVEAFFVSFTGHTVVHIRPLGVLTLGGMEQVLGGIAQLTQSLEPQLGVFLLIFSGVQEQRSDLLIAGLLGDGGEVGVLVPGLTLTGKG